MIDYRRPKDEVAAEDPNRDEAICPQCEALATTTIEDNRVEFGDLQIVATMPVRACSDCDIQFVDYVGARIETEAIYRHHGLLTPWEIRDLRERRGLSRAAFAEITGLGEATIKRWETGAVAQNRANDRYLRLLDADTGWSLLQQLVAPRRKPEQDRVVEGPWRQLSQESSVELRRETEGFSLHRSKAA